MVSVSGSWWPYLAVTLLWAVVCGHFLYRAWRARTRYRPSDDGFTALPERRSAQRMQDTQAGRI